ncbi:HCLS1-associated protein X-1 isoform 2-T2 [Aulostomus maculatus]
MSVFDLFRGFFGVPGGHYRGRRDPFFDAMTRDDDEDDDDDDGFTYDGFRGDQQDNFFGGGRFGFSLGPSFGLSIGPDGMKIQESPVFGSVLREMEEMFSQLGHWDRQSESEFSSVPSIMPPPPHQDGTQKEGRASPGNPLRDFMLKSPNGDQRRSHSDLPREPRNYGGPSYSSPEFPSSPFSGLMPFSKFNDIWRQMPQTTPEDECKEDRDLDSAVSSGGLHQILSPPGGGQPQTGSFFKSITVIRVTKPDGSVEERRIVRDSSSNQETTVIHSGDPGLWGGPDRQPGPALPGFNVYSDVSA